MMSIWSGTLDTGRFLSKIELHITKCIDVVAVEDSTIHNIVKKSYSDIYFAEDGTRANWRKERSV